MSECPYCGATVETIQDEIEHMNGVHPQIVTERLLDAGFSWDEIENQLLTKAEIYEYKKINVSNETPPRIEAAANRWAAMGWRTVAVIPGDKVRGYADVLLVERKKESNGRKVG